MINLNNPKMLTSIEKNELVSEILYYSRSSLNNIQIILIIFSAILISGKNLSSTHLLHLILFTLFYLLGKFLQKHSFILLQRYSKWNVFRNDSLRQSFIIPLVLLIIAICLYQALPFWLYSFVLLYFSIGYATQSIISYLQFTSTDLFYPLPIGATKIGNKRVLKKILPEWCYFKNVNIAYTNEQLVKTFKHYRILNIVLKWIAYPSAIYFIGKLLLSIS